MLARDLIDEVVAGVYKEKAHVRAIIDDGHWWHVHRDEELPDDYPVVVYIRV